MIQPPTSSSFSSAKSRISILRRFSIRENPLGPSLSSWTSVQCHDIFTSWISNPRPDFLERCGPKKRTTKDTLVGIEVCTSPFGAYVFGRWIEIDSFWT
ncbi:hypothetical protein SBY92_004439 [Candida maltosa Xu316]